MIVEHDLQVIVDGGLVVVDEAESVAVLVLNLRLS